MGDSEAEKIVAAYLDALEDRDFERLRSYLSDSGFSYRSPVSEANDADTYIIIVSRVGPILESIERVRTFVDGNDVCSVLKFHTTMEAIREIPFVQLTTVAAGKIVSMQLFFDASAYNRMFDFES